MWVECWRYQADCGSVMGRCCVDGFVRQPPRIASKPSGAEPKLSAVPAGLAAGGMMSSADSTASVDAGAPLGASEYSEEMTA